MVLGGLAAHSAFTMNPVFLVDVLKETELRYAVHADEQAGRKMASAMAALHAKTCDDRRFLKNEQDRRRQEGPARTADDETELQARVQMSVEEMQKDE